MMRIVLARMTVLLCAMTPFCPAYADIEVTGARGVGVKIGSRLPDTAVLDVPKGAELRLLQQPSGTGYVIGGPYKGTLQQYVDRCKGWRAFVNKECGRSGDGDRLPVGGTRGSRPDQNEK